MTAERCRARLAERLSVVGLQLEPDLAKQIETYFQFLAAWNARMNLTSFSLDDPSDEAIDRLLVEPLLAAGHVPTGVHELIDIGSGGGSPAIPLAMAANLRPCLVESKLKKAVFLREVFRALDVRDARVEAQRFESLLAATEHRNHYDLLSIRAVKVDSEVLAGLQALVADGGYLFFFSRAGGLDEGSFAPPLTWCKTVPLLAHTRSTLVVCRKSLSESECFT